MSKKEKKTCLCVEDFKEKVVKFALDEAEKDCLAGGLNEQTKSILDRLRYWILEEEVRFR